MTWQQVKIKYKNILQPGDFKVDNSEHMRWIDYVSADMLNVTKPGYDPSEELALHLNKGRPVSASSKVQTAVLLHMEHSQITILYCLTLDFLTVSGNTVTLLEPPEDDPVSTLYSNHRLGMSCEILIQVLSIHVCIWQG